MAYKLSFKDTTGIQPCNTGSYKVVFTPVYDEGSNVQLSVVNRYCPSTNGAVSCDLYSADELVEIFVPDDSSVYIQVTVLMNKIGGMGSCIGTVGALLTTHGALNDTPVGTTIVSNATKSNEYVVTCQKAYQKSAACTSHVQKDAMGFGTVFTSMWSFDTNVL